MAKPPNRIKYHLSPRYAHLAAVGHFAARVSKRSIHATSAILALLLGLSVPAEAQLTPAPYVLQQYFDNSGNPASGFGLCVFAAGTSTLVNTYTTAVGSVANANPVLMNAAGRPTSGGIFLTPGVTYKFVLKSATVTTCVPDTGVTIWTLDGIQAVPGSASAVDVTGTAGESIAAGDAVYLSSGYDSTNAGQWYRTLSTVASKSLRVFQIGIAPSAIAASAQGTIRLSGSVTVTGPLSTGADYYVSSVAGAIASSPGAAAPVRLGRALSATVLMVGALRLTVPLNEPCGRLTLTEDVPVTTVDVTAATTLYYTAYGGCNTIDLLTNSAWATYAVGSKSIAVPATTNTNYDVFLYDNAGATALELTAWTNATTRAVAVDFVQGVRLKASDFSRRYLGTFRTTGVSGQTEDSGFTCQTGVPKRFIYNYYRRVERPLCHVDTTANWAYTNTTIRQARASALNQVEIVNGIAEDPIHLTVHAVAANNTAASFEMVGIGENSTTAIAAGFNGGIGQSTGAGLYVALTGTLHKVPPVGFSYYAWLEANDAVVATSFYGAALVTGGGASGLNGWVKQ